jgi:hypothetical protein
LHGDWAEQEIIARLHRRALEFRPRNPRNIHMSLHADPPVLHHRAAYGPQWFEHAIAPGYELTWFRRGGAISYSGPIDARTSAELLRLGEVKVVRLRVETETELVAAAEFLRRRPEVQAWIGSRQPLQRFQLSWNRGTGAFSFSGEIAPQTLDDFTRLAGITNIDFQLANDVDLIAAADLLHRRADLQVSISLYGPLVTDAGMASLQGLKNVDQLRVHSTSITDRSIEIIESFAGLKTFMAEGSARFSIEGESRLNSAAPSVAITTTLSNRASNSLPSNLPSKVQRLRKSETGR